MSSEASRHLEYILKNGPIVGVFTILQVDTLANLNKVAYQILNQFNYRIALQMSEGDSQKVIGPNVVGLKRRGFSSEAIAVLKEAFRFIYHSGLNRSQALERVENDVDQTDEVKELIAFYRNSTRGVC